MWYRQIRLLCWPGICDCPCELNWTRGIFIPVYVNPAATSHVISFNKGMCSLQTMRYCVSMIPSFTTFHMHPFRIVYWKANFVFRPPLVLATYPNQVSSTSMVAKSGKPWSNTPFHQINTHHSRLCGAMILKCDWACSGLCFAYRDHEAGKIDPRAFRSYRALWATEVRETVYCLRIFDHRKPNAFFLLCL